MSWTEQDLLNDLTSRYKRVGTGKTKIVVPEDDKGITWKSVVVFDASEQGTTVPAGSMVEVLYYIVDIGKETESAYYETDFVLKNSISTIVQTDYVAKVQVSADLNTKATSLGISYQGGAIKS